MSSKEIGNNKSIERQVFLMERGRGGSRPEEFPPEEVDKVLARAKQILLDLLEEGWTVYEIYNIGALIAEPKSWLVRLGCQET